MSTIDWLVALLATAVTATIWAFNAGWNAGVRMERSMWRGGIPDDETRARMSERLTITAIANRLNTDTAARN